MIIKKLVIYGYGKWIDKEFIVNPSLQLFYGENEAGKSTLMSFIHSILFGFPTRHSSLSRYEPRESSRYGGKIIIEDKRFGEISIERIAGKVTGDVTVLFEDGTVGDERALSTLLYDKNRHFFESIYSFNLKGIEDIENMSYDQINRFFLSIGALGNERYLSIADRYKTKASQLFKPTGRRPRINEYATYLKDKQTKLLRAKETNEAYSILLDTQQEKKADYTALEKDTEAAKVKMKQLEDLSRQEETLIEIKALKDELKELPKFSLPEDGMYQLKRFNEEINTYREKIEAYQLEQKDLQEEYRPSRELVIYQEFEAELKELAKELDDWNEKIQTSRFYMKERTTIQDQLTETKIREKIPFNESIPKELTKEDWASFQVLKEERIDIEVHQKQLEDEIKEASYHMSLNNDQIDKLEQTLWPLEKFKNIKEKSQNRNKKTVLKSEGKKVRRVLALLVASIVGVLAFLMKEPLYMFGLLFALIPLFLGKKETTEELSDLTPQELDEFYQQKNRREQWREILATNDSLQQNKREKENQYASNQLLIQQNEKEATSWKEKTGQPASLSLRDIEQKQALFHDLRRLTERSEYLNGKIEASKYEWTSRLNQLRSRDAIVLRSEESFETFDEIRSFIKQIERESDKQIAYIKKTESIQRDISYYVQYEKESHKKKRQLFNELSVSSDEELYKKYQLEEKRNEKVTRLHLLKGKLPDFEEESELIPFEKIAPELDRLTRNLSTYKDKRTQVMKQIMEIEREIKELEDGGTYSELLQEFENDKSVYQEIVDEWNTLKVASAIIEKTLQHAKEDKLPQTIQTAETYFSYLTDGEYTRILVEEDALFVMNQIGEKWNVKELSRGTVEPLYIALRLAFIKNTRESIQFPVIIDDSFVNLDQTRLEKMYLLLNEFSKDCQVIYFSFDHSLSTYFDSGSLTHLNI